MSFFGWVGKRRDRREKLAERRRQEERDTRLESLLTQQQQAAHAQIFCSSCGQPNGPDSRYCGSCGSALAAAQ